MGNKANKHIAYMATATRRSRASRPKCLPFGDMCDEPQTQTLLLSKFQPQQQLPQTNSSSSSSSSSHSRCTTIVGRQQGAAVCRQQKGICLWLARRTGPLAVCPCPGSCRESTHNSWQRTARRFAVSQGATRCPKDAA